MNTPFQPGHIRWNPYPFPRTRGESHPASKLSDSQVAELRSRFASGERAKALAAEFGVHVVYLRRILSGKARRC